MPKQTDVIVYEGAISHLANQYLSVIRGDEDEHLEPLQTVTTSIRIDVDTLAKLGAAAKFLHTSRNNFIWELLVQALDDFEQAFIDEMKLNDMENIGTAFSERLKKSTEKSGEIQGDLEL